MVSTTLSIPVYVFPAARQVKEVTQEMLLISNIPPGSLATPRRTPVARRYQDRSPRTVAFGVSPAAKQWVLSGQETAVKP